MAKPTDLTPQDADPTIGLFAVQDTATLGWTPADHVFVHLDSMESVGEFYSPLAVEGEEASVLEFAVADIPLGSLLVDIEGHDPDAFDLNELLSKPENSPEVVLVTIPDDASAARSTSLDESQHTSPFQNGQPLNDLAFPPLTIVIDDDSGVETVAI